MTMKQPVQDAINDQIRNEFYAAYLYLAMAAHFESKSLEGFARWMRLQAQEEVGHAMRLYDFMIDRGARVVLHQIDEPAVDFGEPVEAFRSALEHEQKVTQSINELYKLAAEHDDYAAQVELQWFVTEQVEEEDTTGKAVEQLEMAADSSAAILMLDREFGARSGE